MYNDYPVIYESAVNQYLVYWTLLGIIVLIMLIIILISLSKIFKKANRKGISAWIPLYNLYTLIEITNKPKIYFLFILIPIINIFFFYKINYELARQFKKNNLFSLGLTFLPFIFYPILASNDSEYFGISINAMEEKVIISNIPDLDLNKNRKIEIEVNEEHDNNTNISLGGGVYQKDYKENLMNIDNKNVINNDTNKSNGTMPEDNNNSLNKKLENNKKISTNSINSIFDVQFKMDIDDNNNYQESDNNENVQQQPNKLTSLEFKICPNCGAKVKKDNNICFICGTKF